MLESLQTMFGRTWAIMLEQMADFLPNLIGGIVILVVGLLAARLLRGVAAQFFLAIRLDRMSERLGISAFLARGDVRYTVAEILATTIYWLILLLSVELLGLALGLESVASFFGQILAYLPRVAVALAIIVAGIALGSFFGSAVQIAGSNARFPAARAAGLGVKYLIGFFALVMALEQLQLATQLLVATLQIVIAAVALALALAFGLGCQDLAAGAVRRWLNTSQGTPAKENPKPLGRDPIQESEITPSSGRR